MLQALNSGRYGHPTVTRITSRYIVFSLLKNRSAIDLEGNLAISFRPDPAFTNGLSVRGSFTGTIINRENIGKTSEELVTKWNETYPDDQVQFSQN